MIQFFFHIIRLINLLQFIFFTSFLPTQTYIMYTFIVVIFLFIKFSITLKEKLLL